VVGLVLVSHSWKLAEGAAELAREMGGPDVKLETAGGLDAPDHPVGTGGPRRQAIDGRGRTTASSC
jgi:dihydroxyacetone kinase DhaKLM complex PTS-EIIA-like component DhaM